MDTKLKNLAILSLVVMGLTWILAIVAIFKSDWEIYAPLTLIALLTTFISYNFHRFNTQYWEPLAQDLNAIASGKRNIDFTRHLDNGSPVYKSVETIHRKLFAIDKFLSEEIQNQNSTSKTLNEDLVKIAEGLDKQVKETGVNVAQNVSLLKFVSEQMSVKSKEASSQMKELAANSQAVGESVNIAATDTRQMQTDIEDIGTRVANAASVAQDAVEKSTATRQTIESLSEAANKIGDVVTIITEIAEQTNLLALNATIEAARAGESGKGFAVVASEVKNLANQTAKATQEIQTQVSNVQKATTESVGAISEITDVVGQINGISKSIQETVEIQMGATHQITDRILDAARGAQGVSNSSSEILDIVRSTNELSINVKNTAEESSKDVETMTTRLSELMTNLRASAVGSRRKYIRHSVTQPATLKVDNDRLIVSIKDLSIGGGLITKVKKNLVEGSAMQLDVNGFKFPIHGIIYRHSYKGIHLRFDPSNNQMDKLEQFISKYPETSFEEDPINQQKSDKDDVDLF